jgi:hypothetical protein
MRTVTISENEYLQMRQRIILLEKQIGLLRKDTGDSEKLSLPAYCHHKGSFHEKEDRGDVKPISLKRGAAKGIITYIAEDFDAPLEDFREYME